MGRTGIDLNDPLDRARLRGWVDCAPRLMSRQGMPDAISDYWRTVLIELLEMVDPESPGERKPHDDD